MKFWKFNCRYDCRGALNDLIPYLPKSEGFDRFLNLSNEEKRIESLCDQERYRALTVNEDEELLYQGKIKFSFFNVVHVYMNIPFCISFIEEELKRLQKALNNEKSFSEVAFKYDDDNKSITETSNKDTTQEEEDEDQFEQFIPPYQLDIPVGMKIVSSLVSLNLDLLFLSHFKPHLNSELTLIVYVYVC